MTKIRQSSNNPLYRRFDWLVDWSANGIYLIMRYTRVISYYL